MKFAGNKEGLVHMASPIDRPVNLDLTTLNFPITAIASILHRVSGVVLFLGSPVLLALLALSLNGEAGFSDALALFEHGLFTFVVWGILAALSYHFVAGIKHLFMDMGYGETLESGPLFAKISLVLAVTLMILAGVWIW